MDESNIRTHLQVVGWLNILTNIGTVLIAGIILLGGSLFGIATGSGHGFLFMSGLGALVAVPLCFYGMLGVLAGVGILQGAAWAKVLGIIVSILHLINFTSFGWTQMIGIYTLIVLLHPAANRYFRE
jgi:hypothetical protein